MFSHYFSVAWASLIAMVAFYTAVDIYTPSMPTIANEFSVSENHVQWTMTLFMLGALLCTGFCGPIAERYGRRRVYLWGQGVCLVSAIFCYFSLSIEMLILARFFQGLGGAVASVLCYAVIQDIYSEKESLKIFSMMGTIFATVPALAPVLGGFLAEHYGWHSNFLAIIIVVAIGFAVSVRWFRIPADHPNKTTALGQGLFSSYTTVLFHKRFIKYTLPYASQIICEWVMITLLPFYYINVIGISPLEYGFVFAAIVVSYGIGSLVSQRCIDRYGHEKTLLFSVLIVVGAGMSLMIVSLVTPLSLGFVSVCVALPLFSQGLSFSASISNGLKDFPQNRATASSVRGTVNALASLIGAYMATVLPDDTLLPLSLIFVLIPMLSLICFRIKL